MSRKTVYRSAINGEFVTEEFAKQNPDTTVRETVCDLRKEFIDLIAYLDREYGLEDIKDPESLVDEYLNQK